MNYPNYQVLNRKAFKESVISEINENKEALTLPQRIKYHLTTDHPQTYILKDAKVMKVKYRDWLIKNWAGLVDSVKESDISAIYNEYQLNNSDTSDTENIKGIKDNEDTELIDRICTVLMDTINSSYNKYCYIHDNNKTFKEEDLKTVEKMFNISTAISPLNKNVLVNKVLKLVTPETQELKPIITSLFDTPENYDLKEYYTKYNLNNNLDLIDYIEVLLDKLAKLIKNPEELTDKKNTILLKQLGTLLEHYTTITSLEHFPYKNAQSNALSTPINPFTYPFKEFRDKDKQELSNNIKHIYDLFSKVEYNREDILKIIQDIIRNNSLEDIKGLSKKKKDTKTLMAKEIYNILTKPEKSELEPIPEDSVYPPANSELRRLKRTLSNASNTSNTSNGSSSSSTETEQPKSNKDIILAWTLMLIVIFVLTMNVLSIKKEDTEENVNENPDNIILVSNRRFYESQE
ncbi:hypothetical protein NEOKW01_0820 [Nematocida sp. AWRm80]|nr:hypothetical protein NEOKW01_0820 [Nematocida sp. AWRm80]